MGTSLHLASLTTLFHAPYEHAYNVTGNGQVGSASDSVRCNRLRVAGDEFVPWRACGVGKANVGLCCVCRPARRGRRGRKRSRRCFGRRGQAW